MNDNCFIQYAKNKQVCIFCGESIEGIKKTDRFDTWFYFPTHACDKIKELNKVKGKRNIDYFIETNRKLFFKDKKIVDKDGFIFTPIIKYIVRCNCGYSDYIEKWDKQDFGNGVYACPDCGTLKKM